MTANSKIPPCSGVPLEPSDSHAAQGTLTLSYLVVGINQASGAEAHCSNRVCALNKICKPDRSFLSVPFHTQRSRTPSLCAAVPPLFVQ